MVILNEIKMVYHHVCYEEIHGYDFIILMPWGEHIKLHRRLRKENKCNIPINELHAITRRSNFHHKQSMKYTKKNLKNKCFNTKIEKGIYLVNRIYYNKKTLSITIQNNFQFNKQVLSNAY